MNLYTISVPVFLKNIENLKAILKKGEDFAKAKGMNPETLLSAQLAPDMFPLLKQVQIVSDNAKGATARLAGMEPPKMEDTEKTFPELYERLEKTAAFLRELKPEQFEGVEKKMLPFPYDKTKVMTGDATILQMTLPNFFFHLVTAYDILRNQGVELGKNDFIGNLPLENA